MAKRIESYRFSKQFKKGYNNLPKEIQKAFDQKLALFLNDTAHPSLRVKRIQGTKHRWEGSVTKHYRFTFEFIENKVLFRTIGTHDILSRTRD
jgi:mRNA-degrading endonuclease RelE of RelBE toxin-antitoxin system